jgi:D-serine deaminase-like pyridoxal phosphate-dependent protein
MRRYAPSYLRAFKREVASIPRILYARVRDFSGPNAQFVDQSGTFQVKGTDFPPEATEERNARLAALYAEAFPNQEITPEKRRMCHFLGSLGSHDLSLMRETIGVPEKVVGVSANDLFYSAILAYRNGDGSAYSVTYESGIDGVPVFDAHISVYGQNKRVTIKVGVLHMCSHWKRQLTACSTTVLTSRDSPSPSRLRSSTSTASCRSGRCSHRTRTHTRPSCRSFTNA